MDGNFLCAPYSTVCLKCIGIIAMCRYFFFSYFVNVATLSSNEFQSCCTAGSCKILENFLVYIFDLELGKILSTKSDVFCQCSGSENAYTLAAKSDLI